METQSKEGFIMMEDCLICSNYNMVTANLCDKHLEYSRKLTNKSECVTNNDKFVYVVKIKSNDICKQCKIDVNCYKIHILEYRERLRVLTTCDNCRKKFMNSIIERNFKRNLTNVF